MFAPTVRNRGAFQPFITPLVRVPKGKHQDDKKLFARINLSVKDCRKRMNARGA
jgi:hypothetical protein